MQLTNELPGEVGLAKTLAGAKQSFKYSVDKDFNAKQESFITLMDRQAPADNGTMTRSEMRLDTVHPCREDTNQGNINFASNQLEMLAEIRTGAVGRKPYLTAVEAQCVVTLANEVISPTIEVPIAQRSNEKMQVQELAKIRETGGANTQDLFQVILRKQGDGVVLGIVAAREDIDEKDIVSLVSEIRRQGHKILRVLLNGKAIWESAGTVNVESQLLMDDGLTQRMNQQW